MDVPPRIQVSSKGLLGSWSWSTKPDRCKAIPGTADALQQYREIDSQRRTTMFEQDVARPRAHETTT